MSIEILAKTIYGESDPWNEQDAIAIGHVILNRTKLKNWPNDIDKVCLQPWQFSCWNPNDPVRKRLDNPPVKDWYEKCQILALAVVNGDVADPTKRSTHYFATYIKRPVWAKDKEPVYAVKHRKGSSHLFYNDIDTPPPEAPKVFTKPAPQPFWKRALTYLKGLRND